MDRHWDENPKVLVFKSHWGKTFCNNFTLHLRSNTKLTTLPTLCNTEELLCRLVLGPWWAHCWCLHVSTVQRKLIQYLSWCDSFGCMRVKLSAHQHQRHTILCFKWIQPFFNLFYKSFPQIWSVFIDLLFVLSLWVRFACFSVCRLCLLWGFYFLGAIYNRLQLETYNLQRKTWKRNIKEKRIRFKEKNTNTKRKFTFPSSIVLVWVDF